MDGNVVRPGPFIVLAAITTIAQKLSLFGGSSTKVVMMDTAEVFSVFSDRVVPWHRYVFEKYSRRETLIRCKNRTFVVRASIL
jgi:hypothetical protein